MALLSVFPRLLRACLNFLDFFRVFCVEQHRIALLALQKLVLRGSVPVNQNGLQTDA